MAALDRNPLSQLFSCEGHLTFISQVKEEKYIWPRKLLSAKSEASQYDVSLRSVICKVKKILNKLQ